MHICRAFKMHRYRNSLPNFRGQLDPRFGTIGGTTVNLGAHGLPLNSNSATKPVD